MRHVAAKSCCTKLTKLTGRRSAAFSTKHAARLCWMLQFEVKQGLFVPLRIIWALCAPLKADKIHFILASQLQTHLKLQDALCLDTLLTHCHTTTLSHCHTVLLTSDCHAVTLSLSLPLSYCHCHYLEICRVMSTRILLPSELSGNILE